MITYIGGQVEMYKFNTFFTHYNTNNRVAYIYTTNPLKWSNYHIYMKVKISSKVMYSKIKEYAFLSFLNHNDVVYNKAFNVW